MSKSKKSEPDYKKIGESVYALGESTLVNKTNLYRTAFIKGIFMGLGSAIGATIVLSLVLWLLTQLGDLWLIGDIIELIESSAT